MTFCPSNSAPYKEKPKFWLTKSSLNKVDYGYYLDNENTLLYKQGREIIRFIENAWDFNFVSKHYDVKLKKEDLSILEIDFKSDSEKTFKTEMAATLSVLIKAARNLFFE